MNLSHKYHTHKRQLRQRQSARRINIHDVENGVTEAIRQLYNEALMYMSKKCSIITYKQIQYAHSFLMKHFHKNLTKSNYMMTAIIDNYNNSKDS